MLLQAQNLKKSYGVQEVLDIEKLEIWDGDRIGLVGYNGAGKSTLLHILFGDTDAEEGVIRRLCEVSMIPQSGESFGEADGQNLSRLGLRGSAVMSGGERTRYAIAAAFSARTPLLFADEPTTNLDIRGIETLEKMLMGYTGAVVLISHDRELLDRVCNQIWELQDGSLRTFPGNYSDFLEQKEREREFARFEYEQYRSEKKRLEKAARDIKQEAKGMRKPPKRMGVSEWKLYKGTAAIQQGHVQNRGSAISSRLTQLEKKERPKDLPEISMELGGEHVIRARNAVKVENLSVAFGNKLVLDQVNIRIQSNKKTVLMGSNGAGKTTLIRKIMEGDPSVFIAQEARIGYFSQEQDTLKAEETVLENVRRYSVYPEHLDRTILANLYMSRHDITKKAKVLSGGERVKTALAQILVSGCNVLILDEPTNHMDVYTMEALEYLLNEWKGTVFAVTHDRRFADNIADCVCRLDQGRVMEIL